MIFTQDYFLTNMKYVWNDWKEIYNCLMYLSAEAYMLCMAMDCRIGPQHSKRYAHGMTLTDGTWEQVIVQTSECIKRCSSIL